MTKENKFKFLEGAVAGIALGVAASMFLSSKKGKKMMDNIEDITADFYKNISPKLKKMKKMGEKEYALFMENAVEQYIKTKKISEDMAKQLAVKAKQSWKHFATYLKGKGGSKTVLIRRVG
ncbi:MAG: YtxH domain-containing protein [Candidatus Staskawiczbacteria bacterium]|jgi:gas vesicle protein